MTHEELLETVDFWITEIGVGNNQTAKALRAVVVLHKSRIDTNGYDICVECTERSHFSVFYPCSTIQAIQKELI